MRSLGFLLEPIIRVAALVKFPALVIAIFAVLLSMATLPADAGQKLHGHVPEAVANLQSIDRLSGSQKLDFAIGLPLRNMDELTNLLAQLYDPASTNYHHYLSQEEFVARFGPTPEDYQAVIDYARSKNFTVTRTHSNQTLIELRGTVADIEKAFHLNLRVYQHPDAAENRTFFAPDQEPELDLNTPVLDISGLDNYIIPRPMDLKVKPANNSAKPAAWDGSGPGGNYIGNDFRAAYVPGVTLTGTGQSVGLLEFDGYFTNDIASYKSLAGLPNVTVTNVLLNGFDGEAGGSNIEVALDIEMCISMAPGLSEVIVYEGTSGNTILTQMLDDNIAKQLSSSWTFPINGTTTNIFHEFWAKGISYFNASGDSGAYTGKVAAPADDPYIMVVGGTSLSTSGQGGPWASETVWNWNTEGLGTDAGSGGVSTTIPIPSWQSGLATTANGASSTKRNLPDVALTADNIWIYYNDGSSGEVGGTSAATPLWAAFTALINQQAVANGQSTVGFLNPALYTIGKSAYYTTAFHDITTGNNTNTSESTKFFAQPGYDLCTGWGTPQGAPLIAALTPSSPFILTPPTNQAVNAGNPVTFSVTAVGATTLHYQWQFNSVNIASATSASYSISSAQLTNQGTYSVVVSNSFGPLASQGATLMVYIPPVITTQPQGQTIPQGNNVTLTVAATGTPAPTYQWKFNATNIPAATNDSLTITDAQLANQGNYTVIVSNPGGSVTSSTAVLTVDAPPAIVSNPISQIVTQGALVTFSVSATGSAPLNYQWVFNGANIPLRTNTTFSITNIQTAGAGSYSVIVSNSFGTVTSAVATLTVNVPPGITAAPQGESLAVGNNASFAVTATGTAPLGYQWLRNGAKLADNGHLAGSLTGNLSINGVVVSDAGNYQVIITNVASAITSSVAVLTVAKVTPTITWTAPAGINYGTALGPSQLNAEANYPGTFAYTPASSVTPSAGTNTLSAIFSPSDTLDYNTVTDTVSLVVSPGALTVTATNATRIYGETNPLFTATATGAVNGDIFTATASCSAVPTNFPGAYPIVPTLVDTDHRAGNYVVTIVNGTLTVTPAAAPTIISVTPDSGATNGGTSVTILGTGFEVGATVNFGDLAAVSVNVTNATNIIAVTPAADLGTVDVILTNADGQSVVFTNGYTYVTPQTTGPPPQITGQPTNQSASPGSSAAFTVTTSGSGLTYQWALNNDALTNGTNFTLALSNVQPADAGPYQVIVSNAFGSATSAVATLSILGVPASFVTSQGAIQYSNGQFILQVGGLTGQGPVIIQTSTDLVNWLPIFTNPPAFGQIQFTDPNASNFPYGFYRAVTPASP